MFLWLRVGDVARGQSLTMDMLNAEVVKNLGSIIHGKMDNNVLYTDSFIERIRCQIRGALRGTSSPTPLSQLKSDFGLDNLATVGALIPQLAEEVIQQDGLQGKIVAGSWMPEAYKEQQRESSKTFYRQNNYVSFEQLQKNGIDDLKGFLGSLDPDALHLETVCVSQGLVHTILASIEDIVQNASWCDIQEFLPGSFTEGDASVLLDKLLSSNSHMDVHVLGDIYVVSGLFFNDLKAQLEKQAAESAREDHKNKRVDSNQTLSSQQGPKTGDSKRPQAQCGQSNVSDDDDNDWNVGKNKGKKPKAKRKGKASTSGKSSKQPISSTTKKACPFKSKTSVMEKIIQAQADLEDYQELAEAISIMVLPSIVTAYDKASNEIFTAGAEKRRAIKEAATKLLQSSVHSLRLFSNGAIEFFQNDETQINNATRHLLRTIATACVDSIVYFLMADMALIQDEDDVTNADIYVHSQISPSVRLSVIQELPQNLAKQLNGLISSLNSNKTALEEFQKELFDAAESAGVRVRDLDKKTENNLKANQRESLGTLVSGADSAPDLLAAVVPLLVLNITGNCVSLPGKALSSTIEKLGEHMPEEKTKLLLDFQKQVVQQLKCAEDDETPSISSDIMDRVRQLPGSCDDN